jgi:hypothetical protein
MLLCTERDLVLLDLTGCFYTLLEIADCLVQLHAIATAAHVTSITRVNGAGTSKCMSRRKSAGVHRYSDEGNT